MNCLKLIQVGLLIAVVSFGAAAQTAPSSNLQGIGLYQKGEYQAAISFFKSALKINKKDGEAFYFLGASQFRAGDLKAAQKSLSKAASLLPQDVRPTSGLTFVALKRGKMSDARKYAVKAAALKPNDAEAQYLLGEIEKLNGDFGKSLAASERAIGLNPNLASAYLLKAEVGIYKSLKIGGSEVSDSAGQKSPFINAVSVLQSYPNLSANTPEAAEVRDMIDGYTSFADYYDRVEKRKNSPDPSTDETLAPDNPNERRLTILTKPRAIYTEEARKNGISGTVRLLVLFSKTGKIVVIPVKALPYGLTEQSMQAARQITFTPMQKDGQPISKVSVVEYNFNLY